MPIGPAPDWQDVTWLVGNYNGTPTLVAVDATGRMYAVLYGSVTIGSPVDVNQLSNVREIQGAEGATLHTIAVDELGRIIALIKGMHDSTPTNVAVDEAGRMITVLRDPVSNNYIAVDASGQIIAVMKGMYGTDLKSIAVDSQGRMIMIPTDPADVWGNAISMGNRELSSSLSPARWYDGRGNIFWFDWFEDGLAKWQVTQVAAQAVLSISTAYAMSGAYSIHFDMAPNTTNVCSLLKNVVYSNVSKIGVEVSIQLGGAPTYFTVQMILYDGTNLHDFRWRWVESSGTIQIYTGLNTWTTVATGLGGLNITNLWVTAKMVCDPVNDKYVRLLFGADTYDISAYAPYKVANNTRKSIYLLISTEGAGGLGGDIYLDNVILTQNEPPNA